MRVFISSVARGLEDKRRALPGLIRALGHVPVMFEDFGGQVDPSREACLDGVAGSDVYLSLLGPHYGYRFPETGQSATHDELVEARRKGIDTVVFRKDGVEPDPDPDPDQVVPSSATSVTTPVAYLGVEPTVTEEHVTITAPEQTLPPHSQDAIAQFRRLRFARTGQVSMWTTLPRARVDACAIPFMLQR